ncbi:hypothetical protein AMAG_10593 [Allomyces macrogynus ATCC 38327]|uniref:Uncharacterized protein n=1 Tax=Allomyces macrogynus (strain ATCC 38327) TaxID=578462 RepID=A0A0L0SQW0_ALLM3|nr:hypothetical protein AMAG_10593 [Allomyces macrogynus ATCC 38327]|eukprot:KNE64928.1 hypothetical protein AMAG_10593 [Allomyces macrogynus ATCC 38327]
MPRCGTLRWSAHVLQRPGSVMKGTRMMCALVREPFILPHRFRHAMLQPTLNQIGRCLIIHRAPRTATALFTSHIGFPSATHLALPPALGLQPTCRNMSQSNVLFASKPRRNKRAKQASPKTSPPGDVVRPPARWTDMTPDEAAEWFVDCFRLRMDDDAVWAHCKYHNVYFRSPLATVREFLVFCTLAVERDVAPPYLPWPLVLAKANKMLVFAFEKSDAAEKYGSENVFAELLGGRSLRATGIAIYGFWFSDYEPSTVFEEADCRFPEDASLLDDAARFERVGGIHRWKRLLASLETEFKTHGRQWDE